MTMRTAHAAVLCPVLVACAAQPQRTIEPNQQVAAAGEDTGAATPATGDDTSFVLSRRPAAKKEQIQLNTGEKWWGYRAKTLRMTENQARVRDAEMSEVQAPDGFWDSQTAVEVVGLWSAVCNECHGGRRRLEDAVKMPEPAATWGRGDGLFFGARKRYSDVFATVYHGGPERNGIRSEMPAWKGKLPKELIWAVLYFLEYQSGGIEGRFPPSLYPRKGPVDP
jgi:hypothetical protein